ncbi:MAG: type II toxin-antitoxin system VapC family toxin [Acidimicrobiales bacterium]
MNGYLIDTNVVSELRKGQRSNVGVRKWLTEHADDDLWLSVLVIGELRRGVSLLRRRDPDSAHHLETWLIALEASYADRILPVSLDVARQWSTLGIPDPLPAIDGLLAATALTHELTLVTRNITDVQRSGVTVIDPFT